MPDGATGRRGRRPLRPMVVVLMVLAGGAAACGSDAVEADDEPSGFAAVLARSLFQGGSVVDQIINDSVRRCMGEEGFEIPEAAPASDDPAAGADLTYVETYGYGISTDPPQTMAPLVDPIQEAVEELKPDDVDPFHRALLGSPDPSAQPSPDSCLGLAFAAVEQAQQLLTDQVARLAADYQARVDADPRMVDAQAGWRACLVEQGFGPYRDRLQIIEEISDRMAQAGGSLGEIQAFERQIARVDFDCAQAEFEIRKLVEAELSAAFAEDVAALMLSGSNDG